MATFFFLLRSNLGARDTNTEMVTKIVVVRAANFSTGRFSPEFWRERFCDSGVLVLFFFAFDHGVWQTDHRGRDIDHRVGKSTMGVGRSTIGSEKQAGNQRVGVSAQAPLCGNTLR